MHRIELAPLAGVLLALLAITLLVLPHTYRSTSTAGGMGGDLLFGPAPVHVTLTADGETFWNHRMISMQALHTRLAAIGALHEQPTLQIYATDATAWADLSQLVTEADNLGVHNIAIESEAFPDDYR